MNQSKQNLKPKAKPIFTAMWPPIFENVHVLQGMKFVSLEGNEKQCCCAVNALFRCPSSGLCN